MLQRQHRYWLVVAALLIVTILLFITRSQNRETETITPTITESQALAVTLQATFTPTPLFPLDQTSEETTTRAHEPMVTPTTTSRPMATPQVDEQLRLAQYQYRIGDYSAARTSLTALLLRTEATDTTIASAQFYLARTYLAENANAEASAALAPLLVDSTGDENASVAISSTPSLSAAATGTSISTDLALTVTIPLTMTPVSLTATAQLTASTPLTAVADGEQASAINSTVAYSTLLPGSATNFAAKADFLQAVALSNLGEQSQAIAAYWRFLETYPTMAEFVQPRIAAAYLALGDRESAAVAYRRAADAATDRVAKARLLEAVADVYTGSGNYQAAVTTYDDILALAQNSGYRAEIQYRAGQALANAGALPQAIERWRTATEEAPESGSAYLALVELINRDVAFDLFQRGYIDLQAGALQPAISAFQSYIDSVSATDGRIGEAWLGMGQAYLQAGTLSAAGDAFDQVIANYPACSCFGQAWLDKAAVQVALGETTAARRTYRSFARDYPDDSLAPEALWRSALLSLNEDNRLEAAADLLRLADAFPASERTPFALYIVGFGAYRAGLYEQAIALYERLQKDYPDYNRSGVTFWLGRAHQADGATAEATAEWRALVDEAPDIYYGILAAQALNGLPLVAGNFLNAMSTIAGPPTTLTNDDGTKAFAESWLAAWLEMEAGELASMPSTVAADSDLQTGALLLEVDARTDGLDALGRVYERNKDDPHALYILSLFFEEIGAYRLSIICMSRLLEFSPARLVEDAPIFLQQRVYPRHFGDLITQEALLYKLNPLLYFSLIRQESLFEEGARSFAAAQGLAQIIPDTGHWVAERLGHPEYTNEIIYRPHINLKFGAYYLAWARDYLDGNIISALVGYNAGPGNAQAWREIVGADDTLFVELLTVNEPRIYVRTITANLYHYTRLYR